MHFVRSIVMMRQLSLLISTVHSKPTRISTVARPVICTCPPGTSRFFVLTR